MTVIHGFFAKGAYARLLCAFVSTRQPVFTSLAVDVLAFTFLNAETAKVAKTARGL